MTEQAAEFRGKIVVITASLLGEKIAERFAADGAQVVIAGTQPAHNGLSFEPLDARDPAQSRALVEKIVRQYGKLDVWINGAEVVHFGAAESLSTEQWQASIDLILSGAFYCCQAAGQQMLAQGNGVIINIAATDAFMPIETRVAYSTAKAALVALTEALGIEWAKHGVRVVGIAPGVVQPDSAEVPIDNASTVQRRVPLHRFGTAAEVAETALFIASDQASYIVGETLRVDGGWTAYQLF